MKPQVVAVSWTVPPIVLPRSIQVSRTLADLHRRGWETHVLAAPLDANNPAIPHDDALKALYEGTYRHWNVEFREDRQPSPLWRRFVRYHQRFRPSYDNANWIYRCAETARQILRNRDAVFVSFAQPWIDHQVGIRLKRLKPSVPWVAHFSDPWVDSPYYSADDPVIAAQLAIWREQERAVAEKADALVFVTAETADLVMKKYPPDWRSKVHVVPHGFDDRVLACPAIDGSPAARRPLRMLYTGNIYEGRREPGVLFEVLADLQREGRLAGRFELQIYGNSPANVARHAAGLGLDTIVRFHGPIGYLESVRMQQGADALLLLDAIADVNVFLPSKIVDYLMVGKPILGLTPLAGASADVLRRTGQIAVEPRDGAAIRSALIGLLDRHENGDGLPVHRSAATEAFDIRNTTDAFEQALRAAITTRQG